MSLPPPSPHRVEIEHLVRRAIYQRLGKTPPRAAQAPNPLLVNVSARHCHLTPEAVRTLLLVLADSGEVIEKKKGMWERA